MDPVASIFRHLDTWRHFPAYALERRSDVFFSVYLRGFVEKQTGVSCEDEIIPEFPLKHGVVTDRAGSSQSVKVDFVLFPKDRSQVLFVELKTDPRSRRETQDEYLFAAGRVAFRAILTGVREILLASKAYQKYFHLASSLARLGFLRLPPDITEFLYPKPRPGLTKRLAAIEVTAPDMPIRVLYVQPDARSEPNCFGFEAFATYVESFPDPFSQRFAQHLRAWTSPAGASYPGRRTT